MAENFDIDLVKSTNGGDTWFDISRGIFYDDPQGIGQNIEGTDFKLAGIESILVDPSDSNIVKVTLKVVSGEKINFKSTNGGLNWSRE
jgi:hypothetical protein